MAVIKVKVVSMIGRVSELDRVTEICGRSGVFHPDHALQFYQHTDSFAPLSEENIFSSALQKLSDSLSVFGHTPTLLPEEEIKRLTVSQASADAYVSRFTKQAQEFHTALSEAKKDLELSAKAEETLAHFVGLNLDLGALHTCKFLQVRFGFLPKANLESLKEKEQQSALPFQFFSCTSDEQSVWGVVLCPITEKDTVNRMLTKLYFQPMDLPVTTGTPEMQIQNLRKIQAQRKSQIEEARRKMEAYWQQEQKAFTDTYSYLARCSTYFSVRHYAAVYHGNFVLTGWIPADEEAFFTKKLDTLQSVEYSLENADNVLAHSPPVKLHNHKPVRPYEFFINMYGLPNYKEIDPTPLVAILFTLLFGIMFGDVGQGLCLAFFGYYYMWKHRKMPIGKILLPCGIMATVFGFVFGSFFGNEQFMDPLYHAVGLPGKPVSVMEGNTTIAIILISVAVGFVCVCISMLLNMYSSCKRKNYARALVGQNGLAAFIFYVALVLGIVIQMTTGKKIVTVPYLIILIILPLAVVFLQEPFTGAIRGEKFQPESWGMYFTQSFFEWFEFLLSLMSNTISFLRVGAFVLVHAGMMTMVVTLAEMVSPGIGIGWYIIMVIGNIFVAVLEALLVSIHVLRLNFYEMFSRFYDGDGRAFTPVRVNGFLKA